MTERPGEEDPEPPGDQEGGQEDAAPGLPQLPDDPSSEDLDTVRFMTGQVDALRSAPLVVTVAAGPIGRLYAPGSLVSQLTERISNLLRDVGGGWAPAFYGALGGGSMALYFGDPHGDDRPQGQLPVEVTLAHAQRVAQLIELDGQELFDRALLLGAPARRYDELVQLVQSEGIILKWKTRGEVPRELTPERAQRQHRRLNEAPVVIEETVLVNGVLYRVIADPKEDRLGSVGIRPYDWSMKPPARGGSSRNVVIARYTDDNVERQIKEGLIGESVEARIVVQRPSPGTSIDPEGVELLLAGIEKGPSATSPFGESMLEENTE